MQKSFKTLILTIIIALSISSIFAKTYGVKAELGTTSTGLEINIIQHDQEEINGRLINADGAYLVFENPLDESVQVIPRTEIQILETNLNVNLFALLKGKNNEKLIDAIELNDGTRIACIILDVGTENVQYFTGQSLKRQLVNTHDIYMLHLDQDSVTIPFPVLTVNEMTI
ncbi:MAG: hypothetical protein U9Q77_03590 [Candidatus Marinimicrobia bacterium]|nr:hypothetical protein [Candidatus Neomarinimicrobiota bacterium]